MTSAQLGAGVEDHSGELRVLADFAVSVLEPLDDIDCMDSLFVVYGRK